MNSNIFDSLFSGVPSFFLFDVVINVALAFILGLMIAALYRFTFQGQSYSGIFINTLIIITMVTAVVIMVIGNNLARAFGLVGAMSIIRFRTALKDTRDIAFVFFSLAAGMAAGAGNFIIAIVGIPFICIIIFVLYLTKYGTGQEKEYLLKFWMVPSEVDEPVYLEAFKKFLVSYNLINVRSARLGQFLELSFYIRLREPGDSQQFISELSVLEGIERASIVVGEESDVF
jgi:uncharacterized membrane protein YhiD involved in acid resistance